MLSVFNTRRPPIVHVAIVTKWKGWSYNPNTFDFRQLLMTSRFLIHRIENIIWPQSRVFIVASAKCDERIRKKPLWRYLHWIIITTYVCSELSYFCVIEVNYQRSNALEVWHIEVFQPTIEFNKRNSYRNSATLSSTLLCYWVHIILIFGALWWEYHFAQVVWQRCEMHFQFDYK